MKDCLKTIRDAHGRFYIAGRKIGEQYHTADSFSAPEEYKDMFVPLTFRLGIFYISLDYSLQDLI
jgi:hypothetical protein